MSRWGEDVMTLRTGMDGKLNYGIRSCLMGIRSLGHLHLIKYSNSVIAYLLRQQASFHQI